MKQENSNRIAADLKDWKAREARLSKLFTPDILNNKAFVKGKLEFFDHVQAKYKHTNSPEEKLTLAILKRQSSLLRKEIYPGLLQRAFQQILAPIRKQKAEKQITAGSENNLKTLRDAVIKAGFEKVVGKLSGQISKGLGEFSLPLSYYISKDQKMDFNLSFKKDRDGSYRFNKYQATLSKDGDPKQSKSQTFSVGDAISALQAQNLLSGRAIQMKVLGMAAESLSKWVQLDFNDKNPAGNHKLKQFHKDYGFDLQKVVNQLPLKENQSVKEQKGLLDALANGARQPVTLLLGKKEVKLSIEANPQFKTLNVFDANDKKISIAQALGQPKPEQTQSLKQQQGVSVRKSKRNGQAVW